MIIFIILSTLLSLFYIVLIGYYTVGWNRLKEFSTTPEFVPTTYVSVIIAARNEEKNIAILLELLLKQNYPKHLLEIIVVDDASTDNTAQIVSQYAQQGVRLLYQKQTDLHQSYKKRAIDYAISQCSSTLIITTDADCIVEENWVRTIVAFQFQHQACFVSSPVIMQPAPTLFQKFQALEFAGLVGIGASALAQRRPNMCNGANVAYLKEAFIAVNGFEGNDNIPSGDDEFLMHKMFSAFPNKVFFLKSREAIVSTSPASTLSEFIHQRMRWVSKSTKYEDKTITQILILSYLYNLTLLIGFIGMFFSPIILWVFLIQITLKIIFEGFFLFNVTSFFRMQKLMFWLIPEQLLHIIYVVVIGVLGNVRGYHWKGRKV